MLDKWEAMIRRPAGLMIGDVMRIANLSFGGGFLTMFWLARWRGLM